MGLLVSFSGGIKIEPRLDRWEKKAFDIITNTRHHEIDDFNTTKEGMPSLNCPWEATADGAEIVCSLGKESSNKEWLAWLVKKFERPGRVFNGSFSVVYEDLGPNGEAKETWDMKNGVLDIKGGLVPQRKSALALLVHRASKTFRALSFPLKKQGGMALKKKIAAQRGVEDKVVGKFLDMLITNYPVYVKSDFKHQIEKGLSGDVNQRMDGHGRVGRYSDGEACFTSFENGTLLMAAASCGCTPAIMALLESGADASLMDAKGSVARDYLRLRKGQGAEEEAFLMEKLTPKSLGERPSPSSKRVLRG